MGNMRNLYDILDEKSERNITTCEMLSKMG
jgi:hypothetical protein